MKTDKVLMIETDNHEKVGI